MIALDANVVVRFLTQDDPAQSACANALFARLSEAEPGFVCREVVVEKTEGLEIPKGAGITSAVGIRARRTPPARAAREGRASIFLHCKNVGFALVPC